MNLGVVLFIISAPIFAGTLIVFASNVGAVKEKSFHDSTGTVTSDSVVESPTEEIKEIPKLVFIAENEKDKTELFPDQLLYIESADNYSNIVFTEEAKVKKQLIRSSLKRMESQIKDENILRCHRTFIVNLKNVKNIEGNAAGYKLSFDQDGYFVPVSRSFGTKILEKLKSLK